MVWLCALDSSASGWETVAWRSWWIFGFYTRRGIASVVFSWRIKPINTAVLSITWILNQRMNKMKGNFGASQSCSVSFWVQISFPFLSVILTEQWQTAERNTICVSAGWKNARGGAISASGHTVIWHDQHKPLASEKWAKVVLWRSPHPYTLQN